MTQMKHLEINIEALMQLTPFHLYEAGFEMNKLNIVYHEHWPWHRFYVRFYLKPLHALMEEAKHNTMVEWFIDSDQRTTRVKRELNSWQPNETTVPFVEMTLEAVNYEPNQVEDLILCAVGIQGPPLVIPFGSQKTFRMIEVVQEHIKHDPNIFKGTQDTLFAYRDKAVELWMRLQR